MYQKLFTLITLMKFVHRRSVKDALVTFQTVNLLF